jgi:outer membrane protein assembly factor BamB
MQLEPKTVHSNMNMNRRKHWKPSLARLLAGSLLIIGLNDGLGQLIYSNDFSGGAGAEWSHRTVSTTPIGARRFLGEFANNTVSLSLSSLPAHAEVTVEFDLFILRTMDGNGDTDGQGVPDLWRLSVAGGPTLVNASFMNSFLVMKNSVQSYPDDFGVGTHEGRTGAVENNTLGFTWWYNWPLDSVYHLAYTFAHSSGSIVLYFRGISDSGDLGDESWGLDNVVVHAGPRTPVITCGPENQYASVGASTSFSVRAAGGLELMYQWLHNGTPLSGETNSTLTLDNIQVTNAGAYKVEVSSTEGSTVSRPASLTVFPLRPAMLWKLTASGPICAPPAVGRDGTVYFASALPPTQGRLYAVNLSGSNTWAVTVNALIVGSPAIGPSGRIYFGSRNNLVYCLNSNGSPAWSRTFSGMVDPSPALGADETLYVGHQGEQMVAIGPSGAVQWSRSTYGWMESSAAVGITGTIYAGSPDSRLYAWNALGQQLWTCQLNGPINSSPAIGPDGTIYVGTSGRRLYALSPYGTNKWFYSTDGPVESSPAVGPDGTIYFGSGDKNLYAVDPGGNLKWKFSTEVPVGSSPAIGADGTIFFGPVSGNAFALNPDGTVKWAFAAGPAVFGASPLLTLDGKLYVCGSNTVYALDAGTTLSTSSWPMFRRDPHHMGNAGLPFAFPGILSASHLSGPGGFSFDLYGEVGVNYGIYASPDLSDWALVTNVLSLAIHTSVADLDATNYIKRFYRAVAPGTR